MVMAPSTTACDVSWCANSVHNGSGRTEDKRPALVLLGVDPGEAGGEEATEGAREGCSAVEESDTVKKLVTSVEHGEVDDHAAEKTALCETEEGTCDEEALVGFDETSAHRNDTPGEEESGQIVAGLEVLENPVGWNIDCKNVRLCTGEWNEGAGIPQM